MARQRGGTWQADVILRNGKRLRPGGFTSEAAASLWEAQTKANDEQGLPPPPVASKASVVTSGKTLAEVRELVLNTDAPEGWKGTKDYRNASARSQEVVTFFGNTFLVSAVNKAEVTRFTNACKAAGNSVATVNRKVAALSKILTYAKKHEIIERTPHMVRFKENKDACPRFLTEAEEAQVLATLELMGEHDHRQLTMFLLDTGARVGEALGLQHKHVRRTASGGWAVTFDETKDGMFRTVPLTPRAKGAVDYFNGRSEQGPFDTLNYWTYRACWERCRAKLGLAFADVVIHTFRHTCASRLVQRRVDLTRVRDFMGHKDYSTTLRYAKLAPGDLDELADVLSQPSNVVPLKKSA